MSLNTYPFTIVVATVRLTASKYDYAHSGKFCDLTLLTKRASTRLFVVRYECPASVPTTIMMFGKESGRTFNWQNLLLQSDLSRRFPE
jgi:hypothetical protein